MARPSRRPARRSLRQSAAGTPLAAVELCEPRVLLAAPQRVDINTESFDDQASPTGVTIGNVAYFFAKDYTVDQNRIWKSNGTGATIVSDSQVKPDVDKMCLVGNIIYFAGYKQDNSAYGLWSLNTTNNVTTFLKGVDQDLRVLTNVNGTLYFSAFLAGAGREIWKSDGTAAGTVMVKDVQAGAGESHPDKLTAVGSTLYFTADDGTGHGRQLWKSDGTDAGTVPVKQLKDNPNIDYLVAQNATTLVFRADDDVTGLPQIFKSNGTAAGTVAIDGAAGSRDPALLTAVNGVVFFQGRREDVSTGYELWKTDGTAGGTVEVKDIAPGDQFTSSYPINLTNVNGTLYFTAAYTDPVTALPTGRELWKSNGTTAGTVLVADVEAGESGSDPQYLTAVGSSVYFVAFTYDYGWELWKSSGTAAGTVLARDIETTPTYYGTYPNTYYDGLIGGTSQVFFRHRFDNFIGGNEYWVSNGTPAGTKRVADLNPRNNGGMPVGPASPFRGVELDGFRYFVANDGAHGDELWKTDGTPAGTQLVKDIWPGRHGSEILSNNAMVVMNGRIYFAANDGAHTYYQLWSSDGTEAGTQLVADFADGFSQGFTLDRFAVLGNQLFFRSNRVGKGLELFVSDGTRAGTKLFKDVLVGTGSSDPDQLRVAGGKLYFTANNITNGRELWVSDGTVAGTKMVKDLTPGLAVSTDIRQLTAAGGLVYFEVYQSSQETSSSVLYRSDGTAAGTFRVTGLNGLDVTSPTWLFDYDGKLAFSAYTSLGGGASLVITDGSNAGTIAYTQLRNPLSFGNVNGTLFMAATNDADGQRGLAKFSQGVPQFLKQLGNANGPFFEDWIGGNNRYYMTVHDPVVGRELYESDGTTAGTKLVANLNTDGVTATPGDGSSIPYSLTNINGQLMFSVIDNSHGRELYFLAQPGSSAATVIGAFDTAVTYTENGTGVLIDNNATVTDADSPSFSNGRLVVTLTANAESTDRLTIRNLGTAAGQIGVSGNNVTYGGVVIGTFSGGTGAVPLVVVFNTACTRAIAQVLLRNILFSSTSDNPSTQPRTVQVQFQSIGLQDGNAPTKTINVVAVKDAPVIGAFDTAITYTENGAGNLIDSNATVTDVDTLSFNGGKLNVALTANGQTTDRLTIRNVGTAAGQIGVSGSDVTYGGIIIGTFTGGVGTTALIVTFNAASSPAAAQALLRNVLFSSTSDNPSTTPRTVRAVLQAIDGQSSNQPTKAINVVAVNDAPVLGGVSGSVNYTAGGAALVVAGSATATDVDSADLDGGKLIVKVSVNGQASLDKLAIRNQGLAAGQVGVNGTDVTFGGVVVGTFTFNATSLTLSVTFNASATAAAAQAVARNVTFRNTSANPSTAARTISYTLSDGDGGTSAAVTKTVNVAASLAPPRAKTTSLAAFSAFEEWQAAL